MIRKKWNDGWKVSKPYDNPLMASVQKQEEKDQFVTLPHDAMILEKKCRETKNMHQTGFYPGGVYFYDKEFYVPEEAEGKPFLIEFEGIYRNSRVYINGDYAGGSPCGYTDFYISAEEFLHYGGQNQIHVIANNGTEQNSRWYSGSGIYRNVNLLQGGDVYIKADGLRVTTPEIGEETAVAEIRLKIRNQTGRKRKLRVHTEILDSENRAAGGQDIPVTVFGGKEVECTQRILIQNPVLWGLEHPYLYHCRTLLLEGQEECDREETSFGIRCLTLNPQTGLLINGEEVKLRGACIHHDNGIIGACTLERAEERRCRQLKAAGFNCIRSSHHPVSRAMLDACDREGMLVLDEVSDIWTRSKNHNDDAETFPYFWKSDVEAMTAKDQNHPCVIMYITGNEIQEAGTEKGAQMNREIANYIRSLDPTRYTCSAINGLLAIMDRLEEVYESVTGKNREELEKELEAAGSSSVGSDALNSMMSTLNGELSDQMACSQILTEILEEFTDAADVAGYNYLTARHAKEKEINPNRVVLGTETLPSEIAKLWRIVEENSHVIGDMTWTGYDYLGEAGIGNFYYDGRMAFMPNWPSSVAAVGDIDLIGRRKPVSFYREIVYGLRKEPYIAVERLNHYGEVPNKTGWMWTDSISSWTWNGFEGKPAVVEVYSASEEVELFLNGESLGRKNTGKEDKDRYIARYELAYAPGKLEAVGYDAGEMTGRYVLESANAQAGLCAECDRKELLADGADLAYITVGWKDASGRQNLQKCQEVTVTVEGAGTLQGFGNADPESERQFQDICWETYDGYAMAVIRAGHEPGEIRVTFETEGSPVQTVTIQAG